MSRAASGHVRGGLAYPQREGRIGNSITSGLCTKYSRLVPIKHSLDALSCALGNKTGRRLTVGSNPSHPGCPSARGTNSHQAG